MRTLSVLFLLVAAGVAAAEETLPARMPPGATAYLEAKALAGRIDEFLDSQLGKQLLGHPALNLFLQSGPGKQLLLGQLLLQGATGLDARAFLRAIAGKEVAVALYADPERKTPKGLLLARVDPIEAEKILRGVELVSRENRVERHPAVDGRPPLWSFLGGRAFAFLDGDLLAVSGDAALAEAALSRAAANFGADPRLAEARRLVEPGAAAFLWIDLQPFAAAMAKGGKPRDLGQALILGNLSALLPRAPWATLAMTARRTGEDFAVTLQGRIPAAGDPDRAALESYAGRLEPLPFTLPPRTAAVFRLHRNLAAMWSHRDALIAEEGIPGLVEFETNFGNLLGGMSFVEEFLPNIGAELTFLATRPAFPAGQEPAVRYPQFALLYPLASSPAMGDRLLVGFQTAIGVLNALRGQEGGKPMLLASEVYRDVVLQTARFLPAEPIEKEGMVGLPVRFNFTPTCAVVGGWFVLASGTELVRDLIDGRGGSAAQESGVNAGFWVRGSESAALLRENREQLIAQNMLRQASDRKSAEARIDFLLDLARNVHSLAITQEELGGALGLTFRVSAGPAGQ